MKRGVGPVRVFYAYAVKDEPWRHELEKHLALVQRQGMIEGWHAQLAEPGKPWAEQVEEALKRAALILLLISADFLSSDDCYEQQMQRALERQKEGKVDVLPILVRAVHWQDAPFAHLVMVPTNGKPVTLWSDQDAAWTHITEGIQCMLEGKPLPAVQEAHPTAPSVMRNQVAQGPIQGEHHEIHQYFYPPSPVPSPTTPPERVWMVSSARNPFFTGREEMLAHLHERFQGGQAQAVSQPQAMSGLGGIGKTQIAVEYAYRYRQEYAQVLWASAETRELLTTAYTQIAEKLDLPEKEAQDQEVVIQAVKHWLEVQQKWLLILDNADESEVLASFLPSSVGGHVLVTTRAHDSSTLGLGFGHGLQMETFTPEQGALFVLHRAGVLAVEKGWDQARSEEQQRAMQLSQEVGGLPLALDQVGAYLKQTGRDLASYQQLYQTHRSQLLKERRGREHPEPVATTWQISFERVQEMNGAAADLLRVCSFLAPERIPEELLSTGASHLGLRLSLVAAESYRLDQAVEALQAYSLVQRDVLSRSLSVHRLVQVVLKEGMKKGERKRWVQRVLGAVVESLPAVEHQFWGQWERLVVQALACAEEIKGSVIAGGEAIWLLQQTGWYLMERGQYTEAQGLLEWAWSLSEQQYGPAHRETAGVASTLALLYEDQGRYAEAEPLYVRALGIYEQELGGSHPFTATSVNNLAGLYQSQGRYAEAEPLYVRALRIREQELGGSHPSTATSLNNLAELYEDQGRYAEAEPLYVRALGIREQALGAGHPDTARSLNNLAMLYEAQGKYEEAEPLLERAVAILEQSVGFQHPNTKQGRKNYAGVVAKVATLPIGKKCERKSARGVVGTEGDCQPGKATTQCRKRRGEWSARDGPGWRRGSLK